MKYLFLAPHTDDAELACGGVISRFLREGNEVYIAVFSKATSKTDVLKEMGESVEALGLLKKNVMFFDYNTRELYKSRQDILNNLISIRDGINPEVIFMPSLGDFHQDHKVVAEEGLRAFKTKTIYGYEYPWNTISSSSNVFFGLDDIDISKKCVALSKYISQHERRFMSNDFVESWAKINGIVFGKKYAEGFSLIREIK